MSDIELVIKIPKIIYDCAKELGSLSVRQVIEVENTIKNGTPLPKGHGDLKDAEALKHAFVMWSVAVQGNFSDADIASIIYNSPTIIEADTESEEL